MATITDDFVSAGAGKEALSLLYTGDVDAINSCILIITACIFIINIYYTRRSLRRIQEQIGPTHPKFLQFKISTQFVMGFFNAISGACFVFAALSIYHTEPGLTLNDPAEWTSSFLGTTFVLMQYLVFLVFCLFGVCLLSASISKKATKIPVAIFFVPVLISLLYGFDIMFYWDAKPEDTETAMSLATFISYTGKLALMYAMADSIFALGIYYYIAVKSDGSEQDTWLKKLMWRAVLVMDLIRLPSLIFPVFGVQYDSLLPALWQAASFVTSSLAYTPFVVYFLCEGVILEVRSDKDSVRLQGV